MSKYTIDFTLNTYGDRNAVRMSVVQTLSKETPGNGRGELASKYTYYVETLSDGNRIYLKRPAFLHNGFDFVVCIENYDFNPKGRRRNYPTHDDMITDLIAKKRSNPVKYQQLFAILKLMYECQKVDEKDMIIKFDYGFSSDMIIKTLKWLFIEQDIRYWNYSGRDMLWNAICKL